MKKVVIIYGIIAGILVLGLSALIFVVFGDQFSHLSNELFGYLIMIIALSIIFPAIKQYRDKYQGGIINFGTAFKVGFFISLIASTMYVINWEIYMQSSDPDAFIDSYQASEIERMKAEGESEAVISARKEQHEEYKRIYRNPLLRIPITYSEILPVGLLISLLSALLLRKSDFLPADNRNNQKEVIT